MALLPQSIESSLTTDDGVVVLVVRYNKGGTDCAVSMPRGVTALKAAEVRGLIADLQQLVKVAGW